MRTWWVAGLPLAAAPLALLMAVGCSSGSRMENRAATLLGMAREELRQGSAVIRCNPVECSCPPLEMRVADRWIRVDVTDSSVPELPPDAVTGFCRKEAASALPPELHNWSVELRSSSVRWCANGTPFFELSLKSLTVEAPEP